MNAVEYEGVGSSFVHKDMQLVAPNDNKPPVDVIYRPHPAPYKVEPEPFNRGHTIKADGYIVRLVVAPHLVHELVATVHLWMSPAIGSFSSPGWKV